MIDGLIAYFEQFTELSEEEKNLIQKTVPVRIIAKNEMVLSEGQVSKEFFFILNGCIRLFYTSDIHEKTAFFYLENMFVSSYESFTKQTPAKHNLQAIEDTSVAVISLESSMLLLQQFPKFEFLARVMMEEELIVYQEVISSFVTMNAEERYENLLKNQPELLQRIPQYHLATYLGVTPETLSRIRKRITNK